MDFFNSADFDTSVRTLAEEFHAPGLAVSFIQNDKISSRAYGVTDVESAAWCNTDSLFDIGSCSGSFTAAAIGILIEDNENYPDIQWNTPIHKLLPEDFVMDKDEYTRGITVEDILSHRTGLPGHERSCFSQDTPASVTQNLRNLCTSTPLRSRYQYCSMMYTVLTHVIEMHTRTSFADFLRQRLFEPLGIYSPHIGSLDTQDTAPKSLRTVPQWYKGYPDFYIPLEWPVSSKVQGAGPIYVSVDDISLYLRALINKTPPLSSSLVKAITTPRIMINKTHKNIEPLVTSCRHALGWEILFYRGYQMIRCASSINGYSSTMFFLPDLKIGGAVLSNSRTAKNACYAIVNTLLDASLSNLLPFKKVDWLQIARQAAADYDSNREQHSTKLRRALLPASKPWSGPRLNPYPLEFYVGVYDNPGYKTLAVGIMKKVLTIEAYNRVKEYTLTFEHMRDGTVFLASLADYVDIEEPIEFEARFVLDQRSKECIAMLLKIEPEMNDFIHFTRLKTKDGKWAVEPYKLDMME